MSRRAQGPRLYLRKRRVDRRTGRPLPDVWFIRDGEVEIGTGCDRDSLLDAEKALSVYLAAKFRPEAPEAPDRRRDPARIYVAEVLAAYITARAPSLKLDLSTAKAMVNHLTGWWADRLLVDVKRSTCKAYIAFRKKQPDARYKDPEKAPRVSETTASRELDILGGAIDWWNGEDTLTTRPKIWRPKPPPSPRDALTRRQAACLLRAAMGYFRTEDGGWIRRGKSAQANRAHLRRFILIGFYTGTRPGLIPKVLWEESATQAWADLKGGMIYRRGRAEREQRTKKRPIVKLPPRLLAHLRRWRRIDLAKSSQITTVLHHGGEAIAGKIRTGFEGCVADAGLPAEVTPHWMRHTAATWLMEANVDPWQAAGYLGMTRATLEQHYGHHRPTYQASAAESTRRVK